MSLYESVFVGRQDLSANQVGNLISSLTTLIESHSGNIIKTEYCGLRPLAYPIKKNRKGHYVIVSISCNKVTTKEIQKFLNIHEDIIRNLTLAVHKHDEEHSALYQQSKSFRESRSWDVKK